MISPTSIQEVMNRADIIEVVGQFVRLKKRGANYIANCPFHNEKTPSFSVSASKGIYKCFGCGKGGNAVNFIQEHERITYPEAIRWLADYYKISLEETQASEEVQQQQQTEESLRIFNEFAAQYFHDTLLHTEEGQLIGLSYFKERGFRSETITKFRLGYCPEDGSSFYKAAIEKGYSHDLIEKSGISKNSNGRWYDVYRGRVIFPIQSMTGRVLGFGARILKTNEKSPKYINTPENELYVKSKVLYGLYQSRHNISKQDECYLVEGYTDVISLHQGGVENVVASSGTALTEDQLRIVGRTTKNLTILYDGDGAGIKAAMRGMDMALAQSFRVRLALLPEGQDPDSFIQEMGANAFNDYVKTHKRDIIGFRMEVGMKEVKNDPIQKTKLVNEIAETISRINKAEDFALQDHYIKQASELLEVEEAGMVNLVNKYIRERIDQEKRSTDNRKEESFAEPGHATENDTIPNEERLNYEDLQEWQLIRVLLSYGEKPYEGYEHVAQMIYERIDPEIIENRDAQVFYASYYQYVADHHEIPSIQYFTHHSNPEMQQKAAQLLQDQTEISHNWQEMFGIGMLHGDDNYQNDIESSLSYFELKKVKKLQQDLQKEISLLKDPEQLVNLMNRFLLLKKTEKEILQRSGTVIVKTIKN